MKRANIFTPKQEAEPKVDSPIDQLIDKFVNVLETTVDSLCDEDTVIGNIKQFMLLQGLSERVTNDIAKWTLERYHTRLRESK